MKKIRTVAVIPARAGSKRLPGKNIKNLVGKPLIQWTIEAALNSSYIDQVIVSSDCLEVIALANQLGALAPFVRPSNLAGDKAASADVAMHAVDFITNEGDCFDTIIFLQPTSPLRQVKHINEAIELYVNNEYKSCVSVCEVEHSPLWTAKVDQSDGSLNFLGDEEELSSRSQDLATFYRLNGAIYITSIANLYSTQRLFTKDDCCPYIMSQKHSVDIDTELDFLIATKIMEQR